MKVQRFDDRDTWLDARRGRITGTRAGNLLSKRDKAPIKGFYELIAERVAIPASDENVMDRGLRLEDEAMTRFETETGKEVDKSLVIWSRDDEDAIAISPDGAIGNTEAVECKCLASEKHIESYLTQMIPSEYDAQVTQYFVVNDDLQTLHFVFYDPRMPRDFFWIDVTREQVQDSVEKFLEMERSVLAQVAEIEKQLTF